MIKSDWCEAASAKIQGWLNDEDILDDMVDPPTEEAIAISECVIKLTQQCEEPRIVPDGDGGISFSWTSPNGLMMYIVNVYDDGESSSFTLVEGKVDHRYDCDAETMRQKAQDNDSHDVGPQQDD